MTLNPFVNREVPLLSQTGYFTLSIVREKEYGHTHEVFHCAPCAWSRDRGATHTLTTKDGTRPARLMKTRLYVGTDETEDGDIKWDKWEISPVSQWDDCKITLEVSWRKGLVPWDA